MGLVMSIEVDMMVVVVVRLVLVLMVGGSADGGAGGPNCQTGSSTRLNCLSWW